MKTALSFLFLVLFVVTHMLRTVNDTHIFQLNSYKANTHAKWLFKNRVQYIKKSFLFLVGAPVLLFIKDGVLCSAVGSLLLALSLVLNRPAKAKKPLVYTKRVIRLFVTDFLILVVFTFLVYLFCKEENVRHALTTAFPLFTPLVLLLSNFINTPIEHLINRYYINDAKRILNSHSSLITIGVTGSYGKTSVKFMLGTLLEAKFNVLVTPESYNTPLGITKTIRSSLRATHDVFVCEMGAKWVGDIKEICDIVHPDLGIITSVGPQHLESFKTLDNVKKTKFELADALDADKKLFLNYNDPNITSYPHPHAAISYGFGRECDYYADGIAVTSHGTSFDVHHGDETVSFSMPLLGTHNVLNLLGAIAVCHELGIELNRLPAFAKKLRPVPHRLQPSKRGNVTVIDDAYNSNPSGVKAAMEVLSLFDGFKIVITPGIVELGSVLEKENYKFGALMAGVCDYVVLVGAKQTEPIYNGLIENGYAEEKIFVAAELSEAVNLAFSMDVGEKEKIVLFENDLPDNY